MPNTTCTICNRATPAEDILEFAEHLLYPDCITRYTTECQCCGERIWSADNAGSHSFPLCRDCYDRHYTHCSSCGCVIHAGDAYYIKEVPLRAGDILRIDKSGELTYSNFTMKPMYTRPYSFALWDYYPSCIKTEESYLDDLYSISGAFGYTREDIDALLAEGITPEEIEEYFYGMVPYEL